MRTKPQKLNASGQTALRALREAVAQAIREHHRAGRPVAVSKHGKIVLLFPGGRLVNVRARRRAD